MYLCQRREPFEARYSILQDSHRLLWIWARVQMLVLRDEGLDVHQKESAVRAITFLAGDHEHCVTLVKLEAIQDLCNLIGCRQEAPNSPPISPPNSPPRATLPPPIITKLAVMTLDKLTDPTPNVDLLVQAGGVALMQQVVREGAPEAKLCAACLLQKVPDSRKNSKQTIGGALANSAQYWNSSLRTLLPSLKAKLNVDINGSDCRTSPTYVHHSHDSLMALNVNQPIPSS